jgi:site-specific DNA-methyltransferase (adenine-specific)/adenine-specific DNA-methyltransferase
MPRTELVWPGKYLDDGTRHRPPPAPAVLRRAERHGGPPNLLIHGDNLPVLDALAPDYSDKIDLIYLDPPFATGRDRRAYTDRWGDDPGAYLAMLAPRLERQRSLLAPTGSLFVHVDYRAAAYVRLLLDEVFGPASFRNEIVWHYQSGGRPRSHYPRKHDTLFWYARGPRPYFDAAAAGQLRGVCPQCGHAAPSWNHLRRHTDADGRVYRTIRSAGKVYRYYDDEPTLAPDVWLGLNHLQQKDPERTGYPTQKPLGLLRRVVAAHCPPGGMVADFFCGSGTTLMAAAALGRRWLGCDSGREAIDTARRRLLAAGAAFDLLVAD